MQGFVPPARSAMCSTPRRQRVHRGSGRTFHPRSHVMPKSPRKLFRKQKDAPKPEAELAWKSPRVLLAVALTVLTVWWRLRNGGELSEAIDDGLATFNDVAMGGSLIAVILLFLNTLKGSTPITLDRKRAASKPKTDNVPAKPDEEPKP